MRLRCAERGDLPVMGELVEQLGYPVQDLEKSFDHYSESPSMGIWVVEWEGVVQGFLAYHVLDQFHGGLLFRIVSLVVDRKVRGQGMGRKLLEWAEREAMERGCEAVELTSAYHRKSSHEFYRKKGYLDSEISGKCYFRKALASQKPEKAEA